MCKFAGAVEAMSASDNVDYMSFADPVEAGTMRCTHCLGELEHSTNGVFVCSTDT